jgi:hypothetical protein
MVEVCCEGDSSGEFWVISDSRGRWRDVEICRDLLEISGDLLEISGDLWRFAVNHQRDRPFFG